MTSVEGTGEPAGDPGQPAPGPPAAGPPAPGPPVDFRILTPANWYVLDLDPATRTASIARLVEQRFGPTDDPRLVQARRDLTALLRGAARDAADNGAVYAALMDALVEGTALSASLLAVVGPAPVDEDGDVITDPAALSAVLLAGELAAALAGATDGPPTGGPPAGEPVAGAPTAGEPTGAEPATGGHPAGAPAGAPAGGEPPGPEPATGGHRAGAPGAGEPGAGEPAAGEPPGPEPAAGGHPAGGPAAGAGAAPRSVDLITPGGAGPGSPPAQPPNAQPPEAQPPEAQPPEAQPAGDEGAPGPTEIVELPAGPAIRLRRRTDSGVAGTTGQTVPAAETQYFVPIPATDRMLVLTFATPNLAYQDEFGDLFDRMAGTLQWQWEAAG